MHSHAGNLTLLLESDLTAAGWDPDFIGPRTPSSERFQALLASQRKSLLKKFTYGTPNEDETRNSKALALFLAKNEDCRAWDLKIPASKVLQEGIGEVKAILDSFCHPEGGRGLLLTFNKIREGFDVGKGSNVGCTNVDFYSKVTSSPFTSTSIELADLFRLAISDDPVWKSAEIRRESRFGTRIVSGSSLSFVPKTETISRTICTEPLANMLFQKGIERCLVGRLRQFFGIDLTKQPDKNRTLARIGSRDDSFATIDLSSASDLNSTSMVKQFFPPSFHRWLERTRSPYVKLPNGELVELHMISSMGNAFTFPLQTALFASVVEAAYRLLNIPIKRPVGESLGNYAVFGDDIIIDKRAYGLVVDLLGILGHTVNLDKSFANGPFRESCGTDWYLGYNVRGVYIKRLDDDCDFFSAINRLNAWSGRHEIPLPKTIRYLYSCCRKRFFVPMHEQDTAGIKVPRSMYHARLGTHEHFGLRYKAVVVKSYKINLSSEEDFLRSNKPTSSKITPKALYRANAFYNADGHLLAALAGRLRDGSFSIREFRRRTVVKVRHSSCWDYVGPTHRESGGRGDIHLLTWLNIGELEPSSASLI